MTITSQDYAALADDAYVDRKVGRRERDQEEKVYLNGHQYKVLEHVDDRRSGYQGTAYQRVDTGEIVVAHRGTEQIFRDAVVTDGAMVITRTNPQAAQALALTGRTLADARRFADEYNIAVPEVTIAGHSLGGALTQITAHHYGLKGETFNAYGAVSLTGHRIPEGGNTVINHVMASDPVSAASPHFGEVRIYATQQELKTLSDRGFSNSSLNVLIPDFPVSAAAASLNYHKLGHFLGDESVLANSYARTLARHNERMIDEYRSDIGERRSAITLLARGVPGGVLDLHDKARGPLEPGEPARREAEQQRTEAEKARMDQPTHPGYTLFKDAQRGVHEQDARVSRTPDQGSDQLAGSLATRMYAAGGQRIDAVVMSADAANTFAVQGKLDDPAHLRVVVPTMAAMQTPLEQSTRVMEQDAATRQLAQSDERIQAQTAERGRNT